MEGDDTGQMKRTLFPVEYNATQMGGYVVM